MDGGLILAGVVALATVVAVPTGILVALRRRSGVGRAVRVGAFILAGTGVFAVAAVAILMATAHSGTGSQAYDPEVDRGKPSAELASAALSCDRSRYQHGDPAAIASWWTLVDEPRWEPADASGGDTVPSVAITVVPYGDQAAAPTAMVVEDPSQASVGLPSSMAKRHVALTAPGENGRSTVVLGIDDTDWGAEIFTGNCADADLAYVKNTVGIPMERLTDAEIRAWPALTQAERARMYTPVPATPRTLTSDSVNRYPGSLGGARLTERFAAVMTTVVVEGAAPEADSIFVVTPEGIVEGTSFQGRGPGDPIDLQAMAIPGDTFGVVFLRDGHYYVLAAPPAPGDLHPGHTYGTTVTLNYGAATMGTALDGTTTASVPQAHVGPFTPGGKAEGFEP